MAFIGSAPVSNTASRRDASAALRAGSPILCASAPAAGNRRRRETLQRSFLPSFESSSARSAFLRGEVEFLSAQQPSQLPSFAQPAQPVQAVAAPSASSATTSSSGRKKQRIVVLGTGWAALPFVKAIDDSLYEVVMVSPRNYFVFTPLLAGTCVGTLDFRSIIEPIRAYKQKVKYYEAACTSINFERKVIYCTNERQQHCFALDYDKLVVAVGVTTSTFGTPGVEEHTLYLKEVSHAQAIRQRIIECFESASFPGVTEEDRLRALHFIIVGGGPTGVEFAAELYDFVNEDVRRLFPDLVKDVKITLLQSGKKLLTQFDDSLGDYALKNFKRQGIDVRTGARVVKVTEREVFMNNGEVIPYGMVVWSAGNGPRDLVRELIQGIGTKLKKEGLLGKGTSVSGSGGVLEGARLITDASLKVKFVDDIYALGDCCVQEDLALPPTAQVAQQQGIFLAKEFNRAARSGEPIQKPFKYMHLGTLAYVGSNKALADQPLGTPIYLKGALTWLFWRSVYMAKLFSMKSRFMVGIDWMRTAVFGRDVSGIMGDAYDVTKRSRILLSDETLSSAARTAAEMESVKKAISGVDNEEA
eukprot:tig00020830_g14447.t1